MRWTDDTRVAPLGAFFHDRPPEHVVAEAERSAEVTHAHPEARAGAAAVALASWRAARSRGARSPAWDDLWAAVTAPLDPTLQTVRGLRAAARLATDAALGQAVFQLGNGARVTCADTVPLAVWIASGGDTDTIAAIVGGIVAARVGAHTIPSAWRERVEPLWHQADG